MGEDLEQLGARVVEAARKQGADVAEALVRAHRELSVQVRKGDVEMVEEAASRGIGLRVFVGDRSGSMATSDLTDTGLEALVEGALEVAKHSEADPDARPPETRAFEQPDLDLLDRSLEDFGARDAEAWAREAESAAFAVSDRITNSEGASCGRVVGGVALVTSQGFSGLYEGSRVSIGVQPVAPDGDKLRTAADWDARRFRHALRSPEAIGKEAGERVVAKLGASKIESQQLPVIFHPDAGRALLSALFGCISGSAVYRRSTYLADREGTPVAAEGVEVVDDPLIPRGPASRPFDGEGFASRKNVVISGGALKTFLLDTYSARKLQKQSTASASRGLTGRPSPSATNFVLQPGELSPEAIVRDTPKGLYVTSMMGFGFNPVTGDFSRGAEGFLIENGQISRPVSEITIGVNFDDLWKGIDAIGSDLDLKTGTATPTFRVRQMTVAGT
jgi:PmbA protein